MPRIGRLPVPALTVTITSSREGFDAIVVFRTPCSCPPRELSLHSFPAKEGKLRPADKLQVKAATFLPFVGLARSKQDPINRGHGAQYIYRPPPVSRGLHIAQQA
jgi:hypothetical protein